MSLLGWAEEPKVQEEAWTGGRGLIYTDSKRLLFHDKHIHTNASDSMFYGVQSFLFYVKRIEPQ